jgi:hypothetical protein
MAPTHPELGLDDPDRDEQCRKCQPIVEARFDVQGLAHPGGHQPRFEHRLGQGRVGGGKDDPDQQGRSEREVEVPRGQGTPDHDRQRRPQDEHAKRPGVALPEPCDVDTGGIGEEDEGESQLENGEDGRRVELERIDDGEAGDHTQRHDDQRLGQPDALETPRDGRYNEDGAGTNEYTGFGAHRDLRVSPPFHETPTR